MTHDELLERIRFGNNLGNVQFTWEQTVALQPLIDIREALRAVVELHKPSQEVGGICDENGEELWVCGICPDGDGLQNYPCPTIRAIEKELK